MDLHTWLDKPKNKGRAQALAQHLGVTKSAVSLWRDSGVPLDRMEDVERFTKGAVKVRAMVEHALQARARKGAKAAA